MQVKRTTSEAASVATSVASFTEILEYRIKRSQQLSVDRQIYQTGLLSYISDIVISRRLTVAETRRVSPTLPIKSLSFQRNMLPTSIK